MSGVKHKLHNALEGALAGGIDPVSSPLYVFGPFLKMIVTAGVAQVTLGSSLWMVIITIAAASVMYHYVMECIGDGSGGGGLCKIEFGYRAFKFNAAIAYIEYTLIFLVGMSALMTFLADRFPVLNEQLLGMEVRILIALALSVLIAWMVNHSPEIIAAAFIPATAGVFILLWVMVIAVISRTGLRLPKFNLEAFRPPYLPYTIAGYIRVLAVMAGIEMFADLVPEYDVDGAERSKKAFRSLLIIMVTTAVTMLIVGPAIYQLADPNSEISVFTQVMDQLLPRPVAYAGSVLGVFIFIYVCATSMQAMQSLTQNLARNHYMPESACEENEHHALVKPVRFELFAIILVIALIGLSEELYLEIYDAGVFIIISLTGWAVLKHLYQEMQTSITARHLGTFFASALTTLLTTAACVLIFIERFFEGAWIYFVITPIFFYIFSYFHKHYRMLKKQFSK